MLRPFLLIGVGGSGGKTLRVVHDDLRRRLDQVGWRGDLPRAWQFLHVDVPTFADGNDPDLPEQLPLRDYQGLVGTGLTYRTIDSALAGTGRTLLGDVLAGWRPDPKQVSVPVEKGAGQYRALGRMLTIAHLQRVKEALDRARREMHGAEVTGELAEVTRRLGGCPLPVADDPVVIVVSSIAGGSGAGAVIDICDAVRSLGEVWASESSAILYAPDVFDYLPQERRKGVRPNALATLSELLAAYWNTDGPSEGTATLLARQGLQLGPVDRLGPRYSFLVGARNEHVSFATQNDIYRAMGRSLAAWVASEHLQDRMTSYLQGNWQASATGVEDRLPLKLGYMETPFSAFGSARIGLGRDRFREYAGQRLARLGVERVLRRHEALRVPGDERTENALVAETAELAFGSFLAQTGLDERGESRNEVLDALRGSGHRARLETLVEEITAEVTRGAPEKGYAPRAWAARIQTRLRDRRTALLEEAERERRQQAREWAARVQTTLTLLAARTLAAEGGRVTVALFGKLETELTAVRDELVAEAAKYARWASEIDQHVDKEISALGGDTLPPHNPQIRAAVKRGVQALDWRVDADLRELAVALLPDLVDNLVRPLGDALRRAVDSLAQQTIPSADGRPASTAGWPLGDDIPLRLRPAANEFLVDPVEGYPAELERLLRATLGASSAGAALDEATLHVVVGTDDLAQPEQSAVDVQAEWVPRYAGLQVGVAETPRRAAFEVSLSPDHLLRRADDWLTRPNTRAGDFLREGLQDYLDPVASAPDEHARRLAAFESRFISAVDAAAPLVDVNPAVLVHVHDRNDAPRDTFFTEIPFPPTSPAAAVVRRVLQGRGAWTPELEQGLTDGNAAAIDVFSVLREPYQPVVFDSLMRPIASEWGSRRITSDLRSDFWRWRRARPLPEFVPVAPAVRRAMVRGWFTAALLGQLSRTATTASLFVPNPTGGPGEWVGFPDPLLTAELAQAHEYLPAVLKSLPLALVAVNAEASIEPVRPYARLRDLGSSRSGGHDDYHSATPELEAWIVRGAVPPGAPVPPVEAAGPQDGARETRAKHAEEHFRSLQERYSERLFDLVEVRRDVFDVPRAYELRDDILHALDVLQRAVRHVAPLDDVWN